VGGANTTSFLAAHFVKRNTKNCGGEKRSGGKRGRAKIPSPQTPRPPRYAKRCGQAFLFARPSVQFLFCRAKLGNQSGFCSK